MLGVQVRCQGGVQVEQVKLFIKQWGVLVAFGVFAVGTLV
jgi:hypothetical protein